MRRNRSVLSTPAAFASAPFVGLVLGAALFFLLPGLGRAALSRIAPHRVLPILAKYHYGCITGNHTYRLIRSTPELRAFARELSKACDVEEDRFLRDAADARVDFTREVLVLVEQFYGGTGMARAALSLSGPEEGVVSAAIEITVPPPPVTPDVARFPFAFAVAKQNADRIEITVNGASAASLPIAK